MKTSIKKTLAVAVLALGSSVFTANSHAVGVNGSAVINGDFVNTLLGDLSNPGDLVVVDIRMSLSEYNTGDLKTQLLDGITLLSGPTTLTVYAGIIPDLSYFNITGPIGFGTFTALSYTLVAQSANFLDIIITGDFNPGLGVGIQPGGCSLGSICDTTSASLRWTFNQDGELVTGSATFNAPAVPLQVSEPANLGLLGIGLVGWAASRRKAA